MSGNGYFRRMFGGGGSKERRPPARDLQILQTETAQSNIQTVMPLQQAAAAGKANLKANNTDDVDSVLDEIAEQNDQMSQIQDALAQSTMAGGIDEDDLLAELDALAEEHIDVAFSKVPATPQVPAQAFPTAPTTAAVSKRAEDIELEKLMAETGMLLA